MVWDAVNGATIEIYVIHPSKSRTLNYQSSRNKGTPELSIFLNGSRVGITNRHGCSSEDSERYQHGGQNM